MKQVNIITHWIRETEAAELALRELAERERP